MHLRSLSLKLVETRFVCNGAYVVGYGCDSSDCAQKICYAGWPARRSAQRRIACGADLDKRVLVPGLS